MKQVNNIVLTGGTGTLGVPLAEDLIKNGYTCLIFTRTPEKHNNTDNIQYVQWLPDPDYISQYINNGFAVINLAGSSIGAKRWTNKYKNELINSRIDVTKLLVKAINKSAIKPQKFISVSASGYYGNRGDEELTENSASGNTFLSNLCEQWEAEAKAVDKSVKLIILRTGLVITPVGGGFEKIILPFKFFLGGKIGNGEQYIPCIYVGDWIKFVRFALQNEVEYEIYNLVSPNMVKNKVLTKIIGKVYHRPTIFRVPKLLLKLLLGEMSSLILDSQRIKAKNIENTNFIFDCGLVEQAIKKTKKVKK